MSKNPPTTRGPSSTTNSKPLYLGRYVTVRPPWRAPPKADGTRRVFFQVPARLRPSDWPSLIPLPLTGERSGRLDIDERHRIEKDAETLLARLQAARLGRTVEPEDKRDIVALNRSWQASQFFKDKKPKTQKGYAYHAQLLERWSAAAKHPPVSTITKDRIEKLLAVFDDRPTTRRHVKIVLKMMLDHAEGLEWIEKNPAAKLKVRAPKSTVAIWEEADMLGYAQASILWGQPGLAALIRTEWEIGQRLTDVRLYRRGKKGSGAEYHPDDGVFRFWQSKTNSYVTVPISAELQAILASVEVKDSPYLFVDTGTGRPFEESRLGHVFIDIRNAFPAGRKLVLRSLRHSCVVQLARSECTVPEIAAITGHAITSVEQILSVYLPRDNEVAWNAQRKRGLVNGEERSR